MNSEHSSHNSYLSSQHMEEKRWVRCIREEGDKVAFEIIYRNYYKRLHGYAYSYLKCLQGAEDVVQTIFLKIWAQRESWNPPGTVKQYLFASVRNEALNVLRHAQVVGATEEEVAQIIRQHIISATPDEDSDVEDLRKAIQNVIDQLPSQCQQVFLLSRKNGLSYREIAEDMNISINTVGTQMGRALKILRKKLSNYF